MTGPGWRLLERRLGRYLPPERVAPMLGDISAEYADRIQVQGAWRARLWLVRETAALLVAYRSQPPLKRGLMDQLQADIVHAWRAMRARPTASLGTVGVLALGIGLVSAMFALADPYVTRPLPFPDADRLASISLNTGAVADLPTVESFRARVDLFAGVAALDSSETIAVAGPAGELALRLVPVSREYFEVLRASVPPIDEWRHPPGSTELPILLKAEASRRIGALGQPGARLDVLSDTGARTGEALRVRYVLDPSFLFPSSSQSLDGYIPLPDDATLVTVETTPGGLTVGRARLSMLARLQPGVTPEQVDAALTTAPAGSSPIRPTTGHVVRTSSVEEAMTERLRPLATAALGAGILVLLVCAANVANLLIARGAFRRRELATREALGASGFDLGRLVLVEVGLLTVLGVGGGLAVAAAVLTGTMQLIPDQYTTLGAPSVTARVVGFACLTGGVVISAGLVPALGAWRVSPIALFRQTATSEPHSIRFGRFAMTAVQTAVAVVLLVGAMLMARSYVNLLTQDPGYDGDVFAVGTRNQTTPNGWRTTVDRTVERLRRLPDVTAAAAMKGPLVENIGVGMAGPALLVDGQQVRGFVKNVSHDFFQTAGGRLLEGRLLSAVDENRSAVVSQSFAAACCEGRSAVGRQLTWTARDTERSAEIVGVVKDVIDGALDRAPTPSAFIPFDRYDTSGYLTTYVVRAGSPGPLLAAAIEREIAAENPTVTVIGGGLMRDRLMLSVRDRSFATLIVAFFGVAAIGVSAAGLVGVVSFVVARRTREIAIRMAIGASRSDVHRLVTREAAVASGVGALGGFIAGGWISGTMESFLFGVRPADPISMVLAAIALVVIVGAAASVPARRAMRLSPVDALRVE